MISRKTRVGFATLLLLTGFGCTSTKGEVAGRRSWLGYLQYGSDNTPEEKEANRKYREFWFGEASALPESQGLGNPPAESTTTLRR
ncbi:hypothetical protein VT84_05995 [Gemmata sp. SH-PL17]|nr:hypothetical protein VT84_05995 [Gemmata sp. SH-PL17]